jgi:hypothetical protein
MDTPSQLREDKSVNSEERYEAEDDDVSDDDDDVGLLYMKETLKKFGLEWNLIEYISY